MEFKEFPKMPRFSREIIITEKIDGTNASIFIQNIVLEENKDDKNIILEVDGLTIRAGSRTRWIIPGDDNFGFANWVKTNAIELIKMLGEGHHFGEWWGSGIQRGYNLTKGDKRFSLFNTSRWNNETKPKCCSVIPELYRGEFNTEAINRVMETLKGNGSYANQGFMNPEGIVIFHTAGNLMFKKTIKNDETPKSLIKE